MRRILLVFVLSLVGGMVLAGCLGGDDSKPATKKDDPKADDAVATDETGSVTGQVITQDLEPIAGASVGLVQSGEAVMETETDAAGKYTFNGVAPGPYRLQIAAPCCRVGIKEVEVTAGEVTRADVQLTRLTFEDLQVPFVESYEWNGFISCGIGTPAVSWATCSELEGTAAEDPNEEFLLRFNLTKGTRGFVAGLDWEPVGGVSGGEFWFLVENDGCGLADCSYTYAELMGGPPLIAVINDADITDGAWKWTAIGDEAREMQFRVFASPNSANLMYQQPFTVYYDVYYWQDAPRDANPVPDQ